MEEQPTFKTADQILEEIFTSLGKPAPITDTSILDPAMPVGVEQVKLSAREKLQSPTEQSEDVKKKKKKDKKKKEKKKKKKKKKSDEDDKIEKQKIKEKKVSKENKKSKEVSKGQHIGLLSKIESNSKKNEDDKSRSKSRPERTKTPSSRQRTRSRSPVSSGRRPRRSPSRSPRRRLRRSRSPDRYRPTTHRQRFRRSPSPPKRSPTATKVPRIDKAQLLEFARQNLKRMQETGSLPPGVILPHPVGPVETTPPPPTSTQFTAKTVAELTDYCKNLATSTDEQDGGDAAGSTFTRHPFQIKARNPVDSPVTTSPIVMNIRNAVALPVRKPEERISSLKQQFPVSSGQQHLQLEWIPVDPITPPIPAAGSGKMAKVAPTPRIVAEQQNAENAVDIGSVVASRISSIRKLQEDQFNVEARLELERADSMTQSWANHHHHTNPMTGEPMPELIDWSGAPQAWARKDQFSNAAPLAGGVGMKLLQKMGWQPGEGLGRNKEGSLEPLSLNIKMDKKGLVSKDELTNNRPVAATSAGVKLIHEFNGKHPVSILHELCTKKHWQPPVFQQVADIGPDHLKHFLFKVNVNGVDYQSCLASTTKKDAKAQAAAACLQALGTASCTSPPLPTLF